MSKVKRKKKEYAPEPKYPFSFDTFRELRPGGYWLNSMEERNPTCFNGSVSVRRYRVTIEVVDDSNDEIYERLLKLWRECDNMHHWEPLRNAAARIGRELPSDLRGVDRKR